MHLMEFKDSTQFIVERRPVMRWRERIALVILRILTIWTDGDYTSTGGV